MENQIENKDQFQTKRNWQLYSLVGLLIILIGWSFYYGISVSNQKEKEKEELQKNLNTMINKYNNKNHYSDSLMIVHMRYNKYRHSAESQAYRDSVSRMMQYHAGDFVIRKLDSAKLLVTDIIIGGGKYDYYFRYTVMDSTGKESQIKPELLY